MGAIGPGVRHWPEWGEITLGASEKVQLGDSFVKYGCNLQQNQNKSNDEKKWIVMRIECCGWREEKQDSEAKQASMASQVCV